MPSRILSDRTHLDKKVLAERPDHQSIPFDKLELAPRVGNKIFRPQKAAYMINNLRLNRANREMLVTDFIERSIRSRSNLPPPVTYSTRSIDSSRPNVSQSMYSDLIASLATARSKTKRERVLRKFQTSRREKQIQVLTDKIDPNIDTSTIVSRVQAFQAALTEMDDESLGELEQTIDAVILGGSPGTSTSVSRLTSAAGSPIQE